MNRMLKVPMFLVLLLVATAAFADNVPIVGSAAAPSVVRDTNQTANAAQQTAQMVSANSKHNAAMASNDSGTATNPETATGTLKIASAESGNNNNFSDTFNGVNGSTTNAANDLSFDAPAMNNEQMKPAPEPRKASF